MAITWVERQPAGDFDKNWFPSASDSDGSNLISGEYNGRLYTSADYGATWTERQPAGAADKQWRGVASDDDGSNLITCVGGGRLYTSSDFGVTWVERQPAGDVDRVWGEVASDSDGSNLIALNTAGIVYVSDDSGVTWTECTPATKNWQAVASDSDGSNLMIGSVSVGGRLYTSSDGGTNWTERQPAGNADRWWYGLASDSDGSVLIAGNAGTDGAGASGRLYTSADSGVTWTERRPAGDVDRPWFGAASNSDGSRLMVGVSGKRIWVSDDSGVTWGEERPAGDVDKAWKFIASDSDGSNYIVGVYGGRLYTGTQPIGPTITSITPDSEQVGDPVTIAGTDFGATQEASTVKFNGTAVTSVSSWADLEIICLVPVGATTGDVIVTVDGNPSPGEAFTVLPNPVISALTPDSGWIGDPVTIDGSNFGAVQGAASVEFNGVTASIVSWSDIQIDCTVPAGATTGNVVVKDV